MAEALIELRGLRQQFQAGEETLTVLKDIDLTIERGEMVAIVGTSGSGKSTLMNILGCLMRPSGGSYRLGGKEVSTREPDELAALRREYFGFIFQRYHLLGDLSALGNVEVPAVYAGVDRDERRERAAGLLKRLNMADRLDHRPGQLSGGQQQRVSIARALMNGGEVILADEPTGALDRHTGEEVLGILEQLNAEGRTVIIVTHDMAVAERANRIIELSDGEIIADRRKPARPAPGTPRGQAAAGGRLGMMADRAREALRMALISMNAHRMRSFLTMLGIIIGIASVVCVVALGEGSRRRVLENIASLGTNTLEVFPGTGFGDIRSSRIRTLVIGDVEALREQDYVAAITPTVSTSSSLRFQATEATALVNGVSESYFEVRGSRLVEGSLFDAESVAGFAQDAVIDQNARTALFGNFEGSPIGQVVLAGRVPVRVVGVIAQQQGGFGGAQNPQVFLPYTTVQTRFIGSTSLRSVTIRVADDTPTALAQRAVTQLLTQRHGREDFFILNTDDIRQTITSTTETLTLLIAAIALISLLVGGIGVMNIMLVSVSERVGEIGVRMAVGARHGDILQQFLIEAVLVCLIGGLLGVALALGFGWAFAQAGSSFRLIYTPGSIALACLCSSAIGVGFGYLPARSAARLDPVVALSRD
ncbi:MacB family efflux pump subunit [Rhodovarius crocodyli]|uniref:Pyoverdine export ATP-binding/permease protein PvdT n=1 Tax=Rhodovarius crocodyli TaxID=1979269 RepID=A0A437MFI0_9PROT|nr:MacB family efflux pump subunit [Rhodovarius crocodyli]RVT96387.1 MacB family efflux pump subunit [Rhodovarius crocodyli]